MTKANKREEGGVDGEEEKRRSRIREAGNREVKQKKMKRWGRKRRRKEE